MQSCLFTKGFALVQGENGVIRHARTKCFPILHLTGSQISSLTLRERGISNAQQGDGGKCSELQVTHLTTGGACLNKGCRPQAWSLQQRDTCVEGSGRGGRVEPVQDPPRLLLTSTVPLMQTPKGSQPSNPERESRLRFMGRGGGRGWVLLLFPGPQSCIVVQSLSHVQLFVTPWTTVHQASLPFMSPRVCSNSCPLS